jgi:hypothetical protein
LRLQNTHIDVLNRPMRADLRIALDWSKPPILVRRDNGLLSY